MAASSGSRQSIAHSVGKGWGLSAPGDGWGATDRGEGRGVFRATVRPALAAGSGSVFWALGTLGGTGGESRWVAGFGRGSATVELEEQDGGTLLRYDADFKVGGKLAQVGSRLVMGATKKTADQFFSAFSKELDPGAARVDAAVESTAEPSFPWTYVLSGASFVVLLIWWFLLR